MRIVLRADAGTVPEIGTGHLIRCLELAEALRCHKAFEDAEILFATRSKEPFDLGFAIVESRGFDRLPTEGLEPNSPQELASLLRAEADAVVFDRLETSAELVRGLKEVGTSVCTFDDLGPGQRHADLAIHALLQGVEPREEVYIGYEYLVLPRARSEDEYQTNGTLRVLVSFGGYDARGLAARFLEIVGEIAGPIRYDLLAGSLTDDRLVELRQQAARIRERSVEIEVHGRVQDFHGYLARSDIALVSGGMTAFECARFGVPAIGLPQYEHQLENLERLSEAGCLELASDGLDVNVARLVQLLAKLSTDRSTRREMSRAGKRLIDGRGLERVIAILEERLT